MAKRIAIVRRDALHMLALLAVTPVCAFPTMTHANTKRHFNPPAAPMRFSRTLVRSLSDGKAITVTRSWHVKFDAIGDGYALSGSQIAVDVDVPPALEPLAEVERGRIDTGLFPIMLTDEGQIMSAAAGSSQQAVDKAIALARQQIGTGDFSAEDRAATRSFLKTLQAAAENGAGRFPRDLFAPAQPQRTEQRAMDLPGGAKGEISIRFTAEIAEATGLLETAERTVTTRIGPSSQTSSERWMLSKITTA